MPGPSIRGFDVRVSARFANLQSEIPEKLGNELILLLQKFRREFDALVSTHAPVAEMTSDMRINHVDFD